MAETWALCKNFSEMLCSIFLTMFKHSLEDYLGAWRWSRCTRINDLKNSLPTIPLHDLSSGHYTQRSLSILVLRLHKSQETETYFSTYSYLSALAEACMALVLILFILFIQGRFYLLRIRWGFFWIIIMCALPTQMSKGVKLWFVQNYASRWDLNLVVLQRRKLRFLSFEYRQ